MSTLEIRTFTSAGWGENAYLARGVGQEHAVAIDPGGGAPELITAIESIAVASEEYYEELLGLGMRSS